jgi:hypothetical protein
MSQTGLMNSRQSQLEASAEEEWSKKKNGILSDDDASWPSVCCVCLSSSLSLSLSCYCPRDLRWDPGCANLTGGMQTRDGGKPRRHNTHASPIVLFSRAFVVVLLCFRRALRSPASLYVVITCCTVNRQMVNSCVAESVLFTTSASLMIAAPSSLSLRS